ncbi:hypothetical protein BC332_08620 [Capsicum chinense]|nr:hypothetical protein BC332_08620 [Capsicum chinense]
MSSASQNAAARPFTSLSLQPPPDPAQATEPQQPSAPAPNCVVTRSQHNIYKPKTILDFMAHLSPSITPTNFKQENKHPEWQRAMKNEFDAVLNNQTWDLLDVNNAFLQGRLEKEVFMFQPPGFEDEQFPSHICRLKKAIYGLKQAPQARYNELKTFLLYLGFAKSESDASLFIHKVSNNILYALIYVNDIIITGNHNSEVNRVIARLAGHFSIKDLGNLNLFSWSGDISFSVNKLSQFMHSPSEVHWKALKRVLRYLQGTLQFALHIQRGNDFNLHMYSDADWAGDVSDRASTTGYILFFGQNPMSWSSRKQRTIARSSNETGYRVVATAAFQGNGTDKLALLGFKSQITEDPSRVFASWNESVHFCRWTGVKCGPRQERVISLNLKGLSLAVNLSHCVNLESLILDHNNLVGQIPYQVGSLMKLQKLYFRNNNLTGGEVPASLAQLTKLRLLGLSVNSLSGEFPPSLYNVSSLELIALSFNNFSGNLKSDLGHYFSNLQRLYLGDCHFIGSIPSSLSNASKLLQLDFPEDNFTGNIPKGFGNWWNLLWLNVNRNHLGYGKHDDLDFVSSLTNGSSLQMLHLGDNQFVGTLPHSIVNLSSQIQRLLIYGNRIGGSIPREISNLVNLNLLDMSKSNLTGRIPDSIGRLTNLGSLNLGSNLLTGVIPSSTGNLTELVHL